MGATRSILHKALRSASSGCDEFAPFLSSALHKRKAPMKTISMFLLLLLVGCANPYVTYYQPRSYNQTVSKTNPTVLMTDNANHTAESMLNEYKIIGTASFQGVRHPSQQQALTQARKVGADMVVCSSQYLGSEQGEMPITTYQPGQSYTTTHYGTIYGAGGMMSYSGTSRTTTPGSLNTQFVPYTKHIYGNIAIFLRRK